MGCKKIRGIGVAEQQMMSMLASSSSTCGNKLEDVRFGLELQQPRGEDEKAAADAGLLLLPHQLQELIIIGISELILQFDGVRGMETLAPLSNLSSLTRLTTWRCMDLRGEGLSSLLDHGQLTDLSIVETPKFFVRCGSYPSRPQHLPTDDIAGALAAPICRLLASSLTSLTICWNDELVWPAIP